jgi:hypothetical protein
MALDALDLAPEDFRERMRRARARGQPLFPWDDVTPGEWRRSLETIGRTAAEVLARERLGERGSAEPPHLAAPAGARAAGIAAFTSGMGALLGHWIERGSLTAEGEELGTLLSLHLRHGRLRAARLEAAFVRVVDALSARGVAATVVKGLHTGYAYFPEPGTRPSSDIDLVVEERDLPAAGVALRGAGLSPRLVLSSPYMCEWAPPEQSPVPRSLELTHADNPWTVDLHASFDRDFGGVRTVSLAPAGASSTEPASIAGRTVRVLAQPALAAYLAAHASQELKNLTLIRLVELVWVLRRSAADGSLDWGELEALLARRGATAYVHPALELVERLAPGTVPPSLRLLLDRAAPARVRRVLARLQPATAQRLEGISLEEHFMWAVGPLEHLRRIRRVLFPSWAGSFPEMLRVQGVRLRQLGARRVGVSSGEPPGR